jgi:hypothetical protein
MRQSGIEARLRRMTDAELTELAGGDLTEEGLKALNMELERRQSPEYSEEVAAAELRLEHYELDQSHSRELSRRAGQYAWILLVLLCPVAIFFDLRTPTKIEPEITEAGRRNLDIANKQRAQLSQNSEERLAKIEEGENLSARIVDRLVLYGGGAAVIWVLGFFLTRAVLSVFGRQGRPEDAPNTADRADV